MKLLLLTKTKNPNVKGGMIDVNKLLETFQNVPKEFLESDLKSLEPYTKAFLLFLLGTLIFTNGSRSISPQYLQLLEINKIDSYAWGAAAIAKLKESMSYIKKSVRDNDKYSSIYGFSLALSVFALERFPFIRVEYAPVSDYPLFFGWMKIVYKPFKQTQTVKGVKAFLDRFRGLRKEDVTWQPYIDRPAQCHTYQLDMIYAYVPCINFADIALNRADLCYEQLGLRMEDLRMPLPTIEKKEIISHSKHRNVDWRVHKEKYGYREYNKIWTDRNSYLVIPQQASPSPQQSSSHHSQGNEDEDGQSSPRHPTPTPTQVQRRLGLFGRVYRRRRRSNTGKLKTKGDVKIDVEHSLYLLRELLPHIKELSEEEMTEKKEEASRQGLSLSEISIAELDDLDGVRLYCDNCKTSIFALHKHCQTCNGDFCLACSRDFHDAQLRGGGDADPIESRVTAKPGVHKRPSSDPIESRVTAKHRVHKRPRTDRHEDSDDMVWCDGSFELRSFYPPSHIADLVDEADILLRKHNHHKPMCADKTHKNLHSCLNDTAASREFSSDNEKCCPEAENVVKNVHHC